MSQGIRAGAEGGRAAGRLDQGERAGRQARAYQPVACPLQPGDHTVLPRAHLPDVPRTPAAVNAGSGACRRITGRARHPGRRPRTSPPIWRRLGRLVFHAQAAPNRMFCRGDALLAIKISAPMPAVGPSLRPCATGGRSAGRPAGSCTRPRWRASGPPVPTAVLSTSTSNACQELPFGSAHENPPGGFPREHYRVLLPARCCLRAPKFRLRYAPLGGRLGSGLWHRRDAAVGDWLFPSGPGPSGLC